jgi:hypothetical protein
MKKLILIIIYLSYLAATAVGQDPPIKTISFYYDQPLITKIIDSLSVFERIDSVIIFMTNPSSTKDNDENIDQGTITYVIWMCNSKVSVIRISDSEISEPIQSGIPLIIKDDFKELAINESENKLMMKPPLSAYFCDVMIFNFRKNSYLFQCGSECSGFKLDHNKSEARCGLISTVEKYISSGNWTWKTSRPYKRFE